MAKARKVVGDQNSQEIDVMRRALHTLMIMLENFGTDLSNATADITVTNLGAGLAAALSSGVDSSATNYTGSELPIEGVDPTPKHPARPQGGIGAVVDLDPNNL